MNVDPLMRRLGQYRVMRAQRLAAEGEPDGISGALMIAICFRESGGQNINNEAQTDKGGFQITEHWHEKFLLSVVGCPEGTWHPDPPHTAYENGYCPTFTDGCRYAIQLLQQNIEFAWDHGIPEKDRVRFAVAGYNCGAGGALKGYRAGNVDQETTGGEYSQWVLARRTEVNKWLGQHDGWRFP